MDNLCHTLTGAALAESGLKHRTRFASVALTVAANLPDIDVLAFATDTPTVAIRRGWTHGVLAQASLPILLAAAFLVIDRWRPPRSGDPPARPGALLLLGYIGVLSHVGMDWLNNYGVRLLMPFSNRWFYGDSVFIVDPWLWLVLGAGAVLARRARRTGIAKVAVLLAAVYIAAMVGSTRGARQLVIDSWTAHAGSAPSKLMIGPVMINPLRKTIIVDAGDYYQRGTFTWLSRRVEMDPARVPKNFREPAVVEARKDPDFRAILVWARFPYYELTREPQGTRVTLADMRFGPRLFRATTVVPPPGAAH
jgi:inner membrane protein